jgi:hypothetical protein
MSKYSEYDNSELKANLIKQFAGLDRDFDDDDEEPEVKSSWGKYGGYELVGNGKITNSNNEDKLACGKFYGFVGCPRTEFHKKKTLDGVNHSGMAYIKKRFHYCNNPRCPICFKSGWAVREANSIEDRIKASSKRFGLAEHVICSVSSRYYHLSFKELRAMAVKALMARGVLGGVIIFHAFRYRDPYNAHRTGQPMGWYWSPHFHCIGFLNRPYSPCRHCSNIADEVSGRVKDHAKCMACRGFEGITRRQYQKDSMIVKVKGARKTIHGTAWYQLNHAALIPEAKRFRIATWFGVCSYRKLKLDKKDREREEEKCPICGMSLVRLRHCGGRAMLEAILKQFWIREWEEPVFGSDGKPNWVEVEDSDSYAGL